MKGYGGTLDAPLGLPFSLSVFHFVLVPQKTNHFDPCATFKFYSIWNSTRFHGRDIFSYFFLTYVADSQQPVTDSRACFTSDQRNGSLNQKKRRTDQTRNPAQLYQFKPQRLCPVRVTRLRQRRKRHGSEGLVGNAWTLRTQTSC